MERYFTNLATAFVRSRLGDDSADIVSGEASGRPAHHWHPARIRSSNFLEIGSGRGSSLRPLLSAFLLLLVVPRGR
jgi:hypothetical protein